MNLISVNQAEIRMLEEAEKVLSSLEPILKDISPFTDESSDLKTLQDDLKGILDQLKQDLEQVKGRGAWTHFVQALENILAIFNEIFTGNNMPHDQGVVKAIQDLRNGTDLVKICEEQDRVVDRGKRIQGIVQSLVSNMTTEPSEKLKKAKTLLDETVLNLQLERKEAERRAEPFKCLFQKLGYLRSLVVESKLTENQKMHLSRAALSSLPELKMYQTNCYQEAYDNYMFRMREESKEYENRKSNNDPSHTEKLLSQRASVSQHKGQGGRST
ncbi:hypothetical protein OTSUT76_0495 [Orientia tsutsugamushi str. UT76]|uniref:Uncharacterized protein n=1 Tax=Orientia tsutsugamushi TaxID=784 RepID=A0A2U3R7B6_ORITS|nr:hypothetical protein [Orientia tsutsugamushi]KJV95187.1 hypothetical protein OTSUT76_0495 [Orientia tsutsugamushi str. UT76]SPR09081.1 Uncharacterised protein [Orientia tsutsugamushi]